MPNPAQTENDLWMDDDFGGVDFTRDKADLLEPADEPAMIPPDLNPQVITNVPEPAPEPQQVLPPPPTPVVEDEPELFQNPDGSFLQIEKSSKGWKATLDSTAVGGRTEVFYGKTKGEMYANIAKGKMEATKQLNKLNRKIKLGDGLDEPTPTRQAEQAVGRVLTADEKVELKLLLETDPDKAFETWFAKRSGGRTVEDLVSKADKGEVASRELYMEGVHKDFLAANQDYYPDPNYENYNALVAYLSKNKIRRKLTATNQAEIIQALVDSGNYTAQSLEEAFTELTEDGLLLTRPTTPKPIATPAPSATPERIVRTETRPRAGLGIRSNEVTPTRQADPTALPDEDLNKLSDDEIERRIQQARKEYFSRR